MKILKPLLTATLLAGCALTATCGTMAEIAPHKQYQITSGEKLRLQLNTSAIHNAKDAAIFRERLYSGLASNGWLARRNRTANRTLTVKVEKFQMHNDSPGFWRGVVAKPGDMVSSVTLKDARRQTLAEFTVYSRTATAIETTRQMIEDNADQIIGKFKGER